MTQFDQRDQTIGGLQQNAGRDINNIFPKPGWMPPLMLPPRAQSFVGREEELAWLLEQLTGDGGKTLALCGPGGMGKTALAAQALASLIAQSDWLARFPGGIFYHSFYPNPSLATAFEELARVLREEPGADSRRAAMRALSRRRMLLVFDGVEALVDTLPLRELGSTQVVLLLSRRQSDAPDLVHSCNLHVLSQDQGVRLLQEQAGQRAADLSYARRLVQYIGGYPLALQLIGSYLSSRQEEVADYLKWFEREGLVSVHYGGHQTQSVVVLLQRTYDSLTTTEQNVFAVLGLLAPASFPLRLVQDVLALPERIIQGALGSLVNLSVLRRPDIGYEVSHPLVHTFAAEYLSSQIDAVSSPSYDTLTIWRERFLAILAAYFKDSNPYDGNTLTLWLPHILPLLTAKYLTAQQRLEVAVLFNAAGFDALTQAQYSQAEPLYEHALVIREQQLGPTHPHTANSLSNLALLYKNQGKYIEAEPLYQRALAICEQQLGPTHPDTANVLNNLAGLYKDQGKYTEAEPLLRRALTICEQRLGSTHPKTAVSLAYLAEFYRTQGKYTEAEPLLRRALAIHEQQLGLTHPDVANSLNYLALLYNTQGKYAEAEPLLRRALTIDEQQLGSTHPDVASTLNNLAGLYKNQGKYTEAEPLLRRALAIHEQQLGPTHPDVASTLNNLAAIYRVQGKYAEAEPLYQRALTIREQQLGPTHPETALSLNNLAALYDTQGKYAEAEPLLKRALAIHEQLLGAPYLETASILNNLAGLYRTQGKDTEAELLLKRALAIHEQLLDSIHPETALILNNLAVLYKNQEKYMEADPLYQRTLAIHEQQLGPTHPETALSLNNLATFYDIQGKYIEAEPLYRRALAISEQQLGSTHPQTQTVRKNYVGLIRTMERAKK
jgi:tetratricopeptide (TPR) repeat protein